MNTFFAYLKKDLIGYITLLLLCWLVLLTDLVALFIFSLFVYLLTEVIIYYCRKWLPFIPSALMFWLFYLLLVGIVVFFIFRLAPFFFNDASRYLDLIWQDTKTLLTAIAQRYHVAINITMIRASIFDEMTKSFGRAIHVFNNISKNVLYFLFALVLNFLLFHEKKRIKAVFTSNRHSLLAYLYTFVLIRLKRFYIYFRKVMGGQFLISLINLLITSVIVYLLHLPHKVTLLVLVFMFGMIPVVGNLISNTMLTLTALFSAGVLAALICLVFLVAIHKLEYFLNSKIVGSIIRLPMFVTLLSLLLGEALLGIWGIMIAIPLVLTIKDELEVPYRPESK